MYIPTHIPVLLAETLELLAPAPGAVVVDCTLGGGGHARAFMERIGPGGALVGFDLDALALKAFTAEDAEDTEKQIGFKAESRSAESQDAETPKRRNAETPTAAGELTLRPAHSTNGERVRVHLIHDSFANVESHMARLGLRADVVLADLGFSSMQMDDPRRGFSFTADGPLDMRFDQDAGFDDGPGRGPTAAQLVNRLSERELADLIFRYGEEPLARKIARKVAQERQRKPIESTQALAELVKEAYGSRAHRSRMHPATRTFMALRIAVNDELGALERLLEAITRGCELIAAGHGSQSGDGPKPGAWLQSWLNLGARVGIISFHSLEDRLVKHAFADLARRGLAERLTRKPVTAGESERSANPRSRSAKLRVVRTATRMESGRSG